MKIAFVIPSLEAGGAERVLATLANHWAVEGREVVVLTLAAVDSTPFFELETSIDCRQLGLTRPSANALDGIRSNLERVSVLRRTLRSVAPDLIVSFLSETNVLTLIASRFLGVPVIVAEHTDPFRCPIARSWGCLRSVTYPWADRIVVLTGEAKSFFRAGLQKKISIVPNPVESSPAVKSVEEGTRREQMVLSVGRLSSEKGYDLLLHAFSEAVAGMPDPWRLVVIGDGPDREKLERRADELGIGEMVSFPGVVRDPRQFYQRAGVFVLSSRYEGFPMGLCEAMACGCAVLATEYSAGIYDIVNPGENGLVVSRENERELSRALKKLIDDEPLREKLGAAARQITKKYGLQQIAGAWEELFDGPAVRGEAATGGV